jgi:hypothetical protein
VRRIVVRDTIFTTAIRQPSHQVTRCRRVPAIVSLLCVWSTLQWADEYGGIYRLALPDRIVYVVSDAAIVASLITRGPLYSPKSPNVYDMASNFVSC